MQLETLERELASRAIILALDTTGKLKYNGPIGAMTPALVQAIKEHRDALLASLARTPHELTDTEEPASQHQDREPGRAESQDTEPYTEPLPSREYGYLYDEEYQHVVSMRAFFKKCEEKGLQILLGTPASPCNFTVTGSDETYRRKAENYIRQESMQEWALIVALEQVDKHLPGPSRAEQESDKPKATSNSKPAARSRAGKERATVYADIHQGRAITDTGASITFSAGCSLSELLQAIQAVYACDRLYICGELPDEYASWLTDAAMFEEHTTGKRGHYLSAEKDADYVARYRHRATGHEIEIRTMEAWFGDAEYTIEEARAALVLLNQYLKGTFTPDAIAYATPALTFQQLWLTQNRIKGHKFEVLPQEIRAKIHSSTGQGRIELNTLDSIQKLPGLYYYDGIFMYAGKTWGMPTGIATHDNENTYAGKVPARYRIRYTVPMGWQHIGLFMTPREQVTGNARDDDSWYYPGEKEQGRTFEAWADGSELDVAYNLPEDMPKWDITILERIVYTVDSSKKPLDDITSKLVKMRGKVEQDARQDTSREEIYKLVRGMIRNILLHGIGSFHRQDRDTTFIGHANEAPEGLSDAYPLDNGLFRYTVSGKTEAYTQQFEHPEWSQLIWARCRAAMTKAALTFPRESIIAIRTDAIAVTDERQEWNENTKVGTLRPKWSINKTMKAPHTFEALDKLIQQHVKGDR